MNFKTITISIMLVLFILLLIGSASALSTNKYLSSTSKVMPKLTAVQSTQINNFNTVKMLPELKVMKDRMIEVVLQEYNANGKVLLLETMAGKGPINEENDFSTIEFSNLDSYFISTHGGMPKLMTFKDSFINPLYENTGPIVYEVFLKIDNVNYRCYYGDNNSETRNSICDYSYPSRLVQKVCVDSVCRSDKYDPYKMNYHGTELGIGSKLYLPGLTILVEDISLVDNHSVRSEVSLIVNGVRETFRSGFNDLDNDYLVYMNVHAAPSNSTEPYIYFAPYKLIETQELTLENNSNKISGQLFDEFPLKIEYNDGRVVEYQ
jgi:hypothetical protein